MRMCGNDAHPLPPIAILGRFRSFEFHFVVANRASFLPCQKPLLL